MIVSAKKLETSRGSRWTVQLLLPAPPVAQAPSPLRVELFGETSDWLNPVLLQPCPQGLAATLELPAGVYSYKLCADGAWRLDPDNARTRTRGGHQNSVLSLGGTPEPLLFAPALPWVASDGDGATVVTAALRRAVSGPVHVVWRECDEPQEHRSLMTPAAQEAEHVLLQAKLPLSAAFASVWFEVAGKPLGDEQGAPFVLERGGLCEPLPAWWHGSAVYTIFVDRFRPEHDSPQWGINPGCDVAAGGHLDGVRRSLDELVELGINVLYLTPIHLAAHCHRYDLVDPLRVDPALGGEAAFARLLDDAHARGMRVLLDFSFAHVGRGFPPFEDVLRNGRDSAFADWLQWMEGEPPRLRHYGKRRDAPLLNLGHPEVRALVMQAVDKWAAMGIDGLRLDAAAEVPHELAREVRARLRASRDDALVLGEVVPEHAWRWRLEGAVDVATDFGFHAAAVEFVAKRSIDAAEASRWMQGTALVRGGPDEASVRFLSTHDHTRFATYARLHGDRARCALGLLLLLTSPGIPALLYGEELGLAADVVELLPEAVWDDRAPMPWETAARDTRLRSLVRRLLAARASSPALARGTRAFVYAEGPLLVYRRAADGEVIDIAVNASDEPAEFEMDDDQLAVLEPIATVGEARVRGQLVTLGANAGLVARRSASAQQRTAMAARYQGNLRALERAFAARAPEPGCRPTRIELSVTERCNLQCGHCINDSPRKTRLGRARTMSAAVLDRLRQDFEVAGTFGFVHGGESLTAPGFFDVLRAIQQAAGARRPTVHLLSNGLLLDRDNVQRFVALGGNSLMVSLDGATAAVNDAIRGQFGRVVDNVRGVVSLRHELQADLRVGLSFVVMRSNVHELQAFVELAASLGVDWVKFEELVARGPYGPECAVTGETIARAADKARALGLVVVEHVSPPAVWRCRLEADEAAAAFLRADEYANRATIHPCRAPWDLACVEPNGDVHAGDFFAPVLGNVMEAPLLSLWNGEVARVQRLAAMQRWVCKGGPVSCALRPVPPPA
jgi:glycosidase/MoaA/NifB/PqqE/SkfB family radical SAM enzyme